MISGGAGRVEHVSPCTPTARCSRPQCYDISDKYPSLMTAEIAAAELYDMDWLMDGDVKLPDIPAFPFPRDSQSNGPNYHDYLSGKVKEPEEEATPPRGRAGGRARGDLPEPRGDKEAAVPAASDASAQSA